MTETTNCPRCGFHIIETLYTAPICSTWDILQCTQCLYAWRTTEPLHRTHRHAYRDSFTMTIDGIRDASEVPAVPPLRTQT